MPKDQTRYSNMIKNHISDLSEKDKRRLQELVDADVSDKFYSAVRKVIFDRANRIDGWKKTSNVPES